MVVVYTLGPVKNNQGLGVCLFSFLVQTLHTLLCSFVALIGLLGYSAWLVLLESFKGSIFCSTGQSFAILRLKKPSQAGL